MHDDVLRVATLNAGSLIEPRWQERRHEILAWLDRLDPDVVCFQEIWEDSNNPNTAEWLADNSLPGRWNWVFGGFPLPSGFWPDSLLHFGSAIFSRWPIDEHCCTPLPVDTRPDLPHPSFGLQAELLHVRTRGIDVFSTHLAPPPTQGSLRIEQVAAIDAFMSSHADLRAELPPVLCGDFNAEPDSDEIRFLCGLTPVGERTTYYQEAWRAAGNTEPGFTNDHRTNPFVAPLNVPLKRIDYIFVGDAFMRQGGAGLVLSCTLAFHEPITGVHASDHFGLVAGIRWPGRPV